MTFWSLRPFLIGEKEIEPRRVKRVDISLRLLAPMFTTGYQPRHYEITEGIPKGARIIGAEIDAERECAVLFVEHESFPEIPQEMAVIDSLFITATVNQFDYCRWGEDRQEAEAVR